MFGFGNKRKANARYDDAYAYEEYDDYEEDYDDEDYEDYDDEAYEEEEVWEEPVRSGRPQRSYHDVVEPSGRGRSTFSQTKAPERDESFYQEESERLRQEVYRLEETTQRLSAQLEIKQQEMGKLSTALTEKEQQLSSQVVRIQHQLAETQAKLKAVLDQQTHREDDSQRLQTEYEGKLLQAQERIQELEAQVAKQDAMRNDLATILIETKEQGREIIQRAKWDAERIKEKGQLESKKLVADASLELRTIKQEAKQYYEIVLAMKEETTQLFERLLVSTKELSQREDTQF